MPTTHAPLARPVLATLYVVATPIGNLEDLSRRAERILGEVSHIAAEDTRRTGLLLKHLGIRGSMVSLHAHNEAARIDKILGWLDEGEDVALVSDAGTPAISDPGTRLLRAVADSGHPVIPVPGPSAVLTALVASGMSTDRFTFLGFLPRRGGERTSTLRRIAESQETSVVFESPERLAGLLTDLDDHCGSERRVAVARELTKLHEEVRRGTVGELAAYYSREKVRGEVTVVVEAGPLASGAPEPGDLRTRASELLEAGMPPSRVARELATLPGVSRNRAYAVVQDLKGEAE